MDIRHLATKGFDTGVSVTKSIVYDNTPLCIRLDTDFNETEITFSRRLPRSIAVSEELNKGKNKLLSSPVGEIFRYNKDEIRPLAQLYDYRVTNDSVFAGAIPNDTSFETMFESEQFKKLFTLVATEMFPNKNPVTGKKDIDTDSKFTPYIPLVVLTGVMSPQMSEDKQVFFNPNGTVSIAEFIDGLNAIKYGMNANERRKKSIDGVSRVEDYFNEGYQDCVSGISSPFYNLYTREELLKPITRMELAYITVICWKRFIEKFNDMYGGDYYLGVSFDWTDPSDVLERFTDGFEYKVSQVSLNKEYNVISLNVKDYKRGISMTEFKNKMIDGLSAIPLPMFMSMLELSMLGMFDYGNALEPLREVSRDELCYFLTMLAKMFPIKYTK